MRLNNYLHEATMENVIGSIKRDCKPYIEFLKRIKSNPLLFRGMNGEIEFLREKVRTDRKPRYISKRLHELLGELSQKEFGWNTRAEGLFCSNSPSRASDYGDVYHIFPIGSFKYVWVDLEVRFQTIDSGRPTIYGICNLHDGSPNSQLNKEFESILKRDFRLFFKDKGLKKDMSENDIVVKCDEYYAFRYDDRDSLTLEMFK